MHKKSRAHQLYQLALAFAIVGSALSTCAMLASAPTVQDEIAIYQAVIRQLHDDTFGGTLEKPTLYIIRATDDTAGGPTLQSSVSVVLSEAVQSGITQGLADLSSEIVWIDSFDAVERDGTSAVVGGGVTITLGNIQFENSNKALVAGSIHIANLGGGGTTYVVERELWGKWVVTGNTGVRWIS